jgi:hypothetical protein
MTMMVNAAAVVDDDDDKASKELTTPTFRDFKFHSYNRKEPSFMLHNGP